uniref:Uncharacterized protein n=1 Tax=Chromera velia CCMP2878 TaxID=1169474 RepID=A0A0G4HMY6_9ALVE|eukprot:Cvel_7588.t1-p1 / transcript=Cvel_7588.t1 / gene=Cvel_7588 / organism=Chromera_velia_CCMP2878 / gene_product=hypothetical protein / transcript_product=hypothetical protein / location=Cvel_scaffold399:72317-73171(-) / protein_length=285 / sequence_SO=supercontig / SO=protein_coding / is_pseudo=false
MVPDMGEESIGVARLDDGEVGEVEGPLAGGGSLEGMKLQWGRPPQGQGGHLEPHQRGTVVTPSQGREEWRPGSQKLEGERVQHEGRAEPESQGVAEIKAKAKGERREPRPHAGALALVDQLDSSFQAAQKKDRRMISERRTGQPGGRGSSSISESEADARGGEGFSLNNLFGWSDPSGPSGAGLGAGGDPTKKAAQLEYENFKYTAPKTPEKPSAMTMALASMGIVEAPDAHDTAMFTDSLSADSRLLTDRHSGTSHLKETEGPNGRSDSGRINNLSYLSSSGYS